MTAADGVARRTCRLLLLGTFAVALGAGPALASRELSADLGYIVTSETRYGSGLVYGVSVIEGSGRFGLGISYMRFTNSNSTQRPVKVGQDVIVYKYKEEFSDSYVSVMATWTYSTRAGPRLIAGVGPQVHFLSATKHYVVERYVQTARESRLGIGATLRYYRGLEIFGGIRLLVAASYSWMESGVEVQDVYAPPPQGLNSAAITAGLAFPF